MKIFNKLLPLLFWMLAMQITAGSTQRVYLSGHGSDDMQPWDFMVTSGMNAGKWTKIGVPSCWELQGFGMYQYGMKFYGKAFPDGVANEKGMYKHTFFVPESWRGNQIHIVFEASMTDTEVKINGQKAGAIHQGGFYRFSYNITERVKYNSKNLLEVTVSKESENAGVNLAERRADYWNFGGIIRPVFLEVFPAIHFAKIAIDAATDGQFKAVCQLNRAISEASIEVILQDKKGKHVASKTYELTEGVDKQVTDIQMENPALWTAETPELYTALFLLKDKNGKILHTTSEKFGFRTIEVRQSDGLYINGVRVNIRGVNRHSFRPETGRTLSYAKNLEDVKLIKSMNMNSVRLSHYPADPEFLSICDSLGLYVMNELGGWHGKYETPIGSTLVKSMVERDQNHPSVIWWSNGNEKGWNDELNDDFHIWDVQKRPVIHPQGNFGGFETMHYRSYGESQEYMRLPEIFMPTEFLHGLYDGGHGAGLYDYWEMMRQHPRCIGGFLWVLADEGVKRVDKDGFIDNVGNYGADGIVGPHHEKEGSYFTIKEIWNPVQVINTSIDRQFNGIFDLENRYDFLHTNTCTFSWKQVKFSSPLDGNAREIILKEGKISAPDIAPHGRGKLNIGTTMLADADVLYLTAKDITGHELWTWSYPLKKESILISSDKTPVLIKNNEVWIAKSAGKEYFFSLKDGKLLKVVTNGKTIQFGNGPAFVAARRADRSLDQFYNHDDAAAKAKERTYTEFTDAGKFTGLTDTIINNQLIIKASYKLGNLDYASWTLGGDGMITLDYQFNFHAVVDLMGIKFDYPEEKVISKSWLGEGPYRVWQNRLQGTAFGTWENKYNDPVPGESFTYPEFKGYFAGTKWMSLKTTEGEILMFNETPDTYLGVYTPRDGRDELLFKLPTTGISILNVIPAMRNKVNTTDLIGPSSQPVWTRGNKTGRIIFSFK